MNDEKKKPGVPYTWAQLSQEYAKRGPVFDRDDLVEKLRECSDFWKTGINQGSLQRIASCLEGIEELLRIAMQPLLEQAASSRKTIAIEAFRNIDRYMERLERKHGPMPNLVRGAMSSQLIDRYTLDYSATYISVDGRRVSAFRVVPDKSMRHRPPCGPRSKTRKLYDDWIKKKRKKPRHSA